MPEYKRIGKTAKTVAEVIGQLRAEVRHNDAERAILDRLSGRLADHFGVNPRKLYDIIDVAFKANL
jgi:hypothetical protein